MLQLHFNAMFLVIPTLLGIGLGYVGETRVSSGPSCSSTDDSRVVNGTDASDGEFPFAVSLRSSHSGSHSCGGSIINENWILTAAHCVSRIKPNNINIQYGVTTISPDGQNVVNVSGIVIHEGYNPENTYIHDIALLKLETPIQLTTDGHVRSVNLPEQMEETPGGSEALLVGWGLDKTGGSIQKHLQKVDLVIFSDEECKKCHNGRPHPSNICAGVEGGGKGQCSGDSGGPLIANNRQVGIVSWSVKPCTIAPYPGVYTEVAHYVTWINKAMKGFL